MAYFLWACFLCCVSLHGSSSPAAAIQQSAPSSMQGKPLSEGDPVEIWLTDKGIKTDTTSLIHELATNKDQSVRSKAAVLLDSRQEPKVEDALRHAMRHDDSDLVRYAAAGALTMRGDTEARNMLKEKMLGSTHLEEQASLGYEIASAGDPSGYRFIVELSNSLKALQRQFAATHLTPFFKYSGRLEPATPTPDELLRKLLSDPDGNVRLWTVYTTNQVVQGKYKPAAEYKAILEKMAAHDEQDSVRKTATQFLGFWAIQPSNTQPRKR